MKEVIKHTNSSGDVRYGLVISWVDGKRETGQVMWDAKDAVPSLFCVKSQDSKVEIFPASFAKVKWQSDDIARLEREEHPQPVDPPKSSPRKERPLKKYVYDIEVFPNFFCATFLESDTQEKSVFVVSENQDDREKLATFLNRKMQLIGFNNLSYDGPVLCYLRSHPTGNVLPALFALSGKLISDDHRGDPDLRDLRYPKNVKWSQMDLMKIMAFDKLGVSLKQTAINLKWKRIQDLPLPHDHLVTSEEVALVLDYNLNDVLITQELYRAIQPQIELRHELSKLYDADLTSASDSKIANVLLEKIYTEELKTDKSHLKDLRTRHHTVRLSDCVTAGIEFQTDELSGLLEEIKETVVEEPNFAYRKQIKLGECEFELGVGGLHSKDGPGRFVSTDTHLIRDCDVASYYPSIMIKHRIKPAHLGDSFVRVLQKITQERLDAKRSGDKTKRDGLKITINSIFGKLGSDTFWLEDAQAMLSVTVSGQLYLLMLIESLALAGISVISANTDGVVCKIPVELEGTYREVCEAWQQRTGFELEYTDYALYVRSDVNNYVAKTVDGKTKEKGRYAEGVDLKKGYKYPIVPHCLHEYFVNGKRVDQTLSEARDIMDFCMSQKSGGKFKMEYHTSGEVKELQKTNRFYASTTGGHLVKRNILTGKTIGILVGNTVQILNDYDSTVPFEEYNVDLDFYRKEALKYIEKIDPPVIQMNFFDFGLAEPVKPKRKRKETSSVVVDVSQDSHERDNE